MSFNTVVTNLLGDIDDEQVWIRPPFSAKNTLHSSLCTFEQTFRCPICGELLHVPVSIHPCQHSFCSECIRAHVKSGLASLKREAKCPVCRQDIPRDLKTLQPNRTVDTMVRQYKGLRDQLKEALRKSCQGNEDFIPDEQTGTIESEEAVPLDNKKRRRTTRSGSAAIGDVTFVPPTKTPMEVPVLRKTRPNTHYMGMNKNKLADLCRKDGLNDVGDAATLKARHQAFTSLYNAECDSFTPRPASEIAQEINKREQAKKLEERHTMMNGGYGQSAIMGMLKRSREAAGKDDTKANISSGNQAFDDKLNNNFAAMTKMLMEQKKKKFQKLNPVSEEDSNSTASISPKSTTSLTLKFPIAPSPQMAMQSVDIVNPYAKGEKNSTSSTTMPPARLSPQIRSSKTDARHFRQRDESYGSIDQVKENMNPLSRQSPLSNVVSPMLGPVSSQYAVSVVNPYIKGQPPTIPSAPEHFAPQTTAPIASTNSVQKPDHKQLDRCNHGDPLNHYLSMMSRQHSVPTVSSKLKGPVEVAIAARLPASSSTKLCVATETPGSKMYCGPRQTSLPVIRNKSPSFQGPWTCGVCTFHNEKKKRSRANCEMCGSSKGAEGLGGSVPMN